LLVVISGCASKTGTTAAGSPAPSENTAATRWTGSFKQSALAASAVVGQPTTNRTAGFGNITLTPVEAESGRVRVELAINASVTPGTQIGWAIFTGPCGAPTPPIAGKNEFPTIEISNSGSGVVRMIMSLTMEPRAAYHANVYWGSQVTDVSNVMMCANLARGGR